MKKIKKLLLSASPTFLLLASNANAQNLVLNGDFEIGSGFGTGYTPTYWIDQPGGTTITGFGINDNTPTTGFTGSTWMENEAPGLTSSPNWTGTGHVGGILASNQQTIGSPSVVHQFAIDVSQCIYGFNLSGMIANLESPTGDPINGAKAAMFARYTFSNGNVSAWTAFDEVTEGQVIDFSYDIAPGLMDTIELGYGWTQLESASGNTSAEMIVDNISITCNVPEPSSAILLAFSSLALLKRRNR